MCGITGIYSFEKSSTDEKIIKKMTSALQHRGPDQSGIYVNSNKKVFLGHRRLSILDLSVKGKQPMQDKEKEIVITYNGETYNFQKIKKELEIKGYKFESTTDTEVLIAAYKEWGINFVKKLNGMFAIGLYDKKNNKFFLVRDRLGIKPLFYTRTKNKLIFSSEIKSILIHPDVKKQINYKAISSYLSYRYPINNQTFFENIISVEPGSIIELNNKDIKKTKLIKYWVLKPTEKLKDLGEKYYLKKSKKLFFDAVKKRMMSDVPLGAYLSGGLDSSAIVAVMAKNVETPIKTFTIGFKEKDFNEFKYATQVAKMHKTNHKEILLSAKNYLNTMKKLIKYKDAPLGVPNEVPLYLMSKELKKHITVVLSGEGADEIFSGYGRLFKSPFDYKKIKLLQKIKFLKKFSLIKKMIDPLEKKYGSINIKTELDHFLQQYTYFPFDEKVSLFNLEMKQKINKDKWILNKFKQEFYRYKIDYYRKISYVFEKLHLPGLLQRVDNCTMATSVEARVPFVDHELVEFMMDVPLKYKMKWKNKKAFFESLFMNSDDISENKDTSKYLLRKLIKHYLPKSILTRKKQGFPVPLNEWFKEEFIDLAKTELLSNKSKIKKIFDQQKLKIWIENRNSNNFGQKLWMILNVEYFLRDYF
ncbi:asparagine synthase (glutamine-hydrolyzing) [Candidatus Woesearchaeota archaeon]|jgi:asparagine synthase (glutamine-hydrolysing)|nr:asparagine synthase (glutamine-hydrolyzing) [Candidatus Woesearchaeota archaeon]MBT7367633.1 asparagine synthase (glutamine-hydrolyzing) [Candidatus Woesearchaeota archaeon]